MNTGSRSSLPASAGRALAARLGPAFALLRNQGGIIWSNGLGRVGAVILLFFGAVAILAPWLAPHDPWESLRDASGSIAVMRPPSLEFPLGTTTLGRDILSQMIHAAQSTMLIGLVSGAISILIGANIGLLAGYYGGKLDEVMMRFTDVIYGMPFLPFIIVLISLFGRSQVVRRPGDRGDHLANLGPGRTGTDDGP